MDDIYDRNKHNASMRNYNINDSINNSTANKNSRNQIQAVYPKQEYYSKTFGKESLDINSNTNMKARLEDANSDLRKAVKDVKNYNDDPKSNWRNTKKPHYNNHYSKIIMQSKLDKHYNPVKYDERFVYIPSISDNMKTPSAKSEYNMNNIINYSTSPLKDERKKNYMDVINNFKDVLKESEKYTSEGIQQNLNKENQNKSNIDRKSPESQYSTYSNKLNNNNNNMCIESERLPNRPYPDNNYSNLNKSYKLDPRLLDKVTYNNKEEIERLKIANNVLNKANLDLKNQNRLLQMELEPLQGNNVYNYTNSLEFDQNLNNFIENLKNALNSSQISNQELYQIIDILQKKNFEIVNENNLLKDQFDLHHKNSENHLSKVAEVKFNNETLLNENKKLNNEIIQLQNKLNEKDEKINENMEKINNLTLLNENYNKNKHDMNEIIENLKNTIEILTKSNLDYDMEKSDLKVKIEELNHQLNSKNYELENYGNTHLSYEKDKDQKINEAKILRDEIAIKEKYIQEIQNNYKNLLMDMDKTKNKLENAKLSSSEKDHTIENLKKSLYFLNHNLDEYRNDHENIKQKYEQGVVDKTKIINASDFNEKKYRDLLSNIESLTKIKEDILHRNLELENDYNENKNKLNQILFEYEILSQKYGDQQEILAKLKEENQNIKLNNITNEYGLNFLKNNDEKIRKINDLNIELKNKKEEIEDLKKKFDEKLSVKDERIKDINQKLINFMKENEKDKTSSIEEQILKNEIERLNKELNNFKNRPEIDLNKLCKDNVKPNTESQISVKNAGKIDDINNKEEIITANNENLKRNSASNDRETPKKILKVSNISNNETSNLKINPYNVNNIQSVNEKKGCFVNENIISPNSKVPFPEQISLNAKKISMNLISDQMKTEKEGANYLLSVYDNKRILSYNLLRKQFKLIIIPNESTDFTNAYYKEGTLTLNTTEGLFIVTGLNSDLLYLFSKSNNTMKKLQSLNSNHKNGSLIYYGKNNYLICVSGRQNKKVEKYINDDFLKAMFKITYSKNKNLKKDQWVNLPDMKLDRANAANIIINEKYLYSIFGYSFSKEAYLETIERLDLEQDYFGSNYEWEEVKYQIENSIELFTSLKSLYCIKYDIDDAILIIGGYNGKSSSNNKEIYKFNFNKNTLSLFTEKQFLNSIFNRENIPFPFIDENKNQWYTLFDDSYNVHILENKSFQYDVINFS